MKQFLKEVPEFCKHCAEYASDICEDCLKEIESAKRKENNAKLLNEERRDR